MSEESEPSFDQSDSGKRRFDMDVERWRARLTRRTLWLAVGAGLPLMLAMEVHLYRRGTLFPSGFLYPLALATMALLAASPVHWRNKARGLVGVLFLASAFGFFAEGLLSDARILLFSTVVLSAVLLGVRTSLVLAGVTIALMSVGAWLHLSGVHSMFHPVDSDRVETWALVGFGFALSFGLMIGPLDYLLTRFERNLLDVRGLLGATRLAQRRTDASLAQYRAVLDAGADGLLVWAFDGQLVDVNSAACTMYGYSREEFLRKTPADIIHPDDLAGFMAALQGAAMGKVIRVESRHRGADGKWFDVEVARSVFPLGRTAHLLSVVRDITDRKAFVRRMQQLNADLERRVAQRTEQLTRANDDLEAFAYSVSHDLQAPLRQLRGLTGALEDELGTSTAAEPARLLGKVQETTTRMETLVREVLHFSRLGTAPLSHTDVPLDRLVAEAREEIAVQHEGRTIHWHVESLPVVRGDRSLLRQVVVNLIANAVKFTRTRPEAEIAITAREETDGKVSMRVEDNGVGFDPSRASELFQVFRRLHPASQFEGTGVGLAHARRIVERHGGTLRGESSGEGAAFVMTLPAARASVEPPAPPSNPPLP